jgi:ABC-type branched-subunit amino acid transport system substrate-binding protein
VFAFDSRNNRPQGLRESPTDPGRNAPTGQRRPGRNVTGLALLVVGGAVLAIVAAAVAVSFSRPVQKIDTMVGEALAPPPVPRGVKDQEIVLGMASVFSGANRELGRAMKAGVEAAFEDVNAAGGVHGRTLRLVAVDDGYEPTRTLPAMKQLVERDAVLAIVGNVGTPTAAVSVPYCMERKVLFFGALSGGDLLRKKPPDRYVFNVRPSYAEETAAAVRWLVGVRKIAPSRIALFAQDDQFGASGVRGAADELRARGVDTSRVIRVGYRRNTDDVTAAVETLRQRAREVDAVVMVATYLPAATFVRKLRDAGLRQVVTDVSAVDSNALAEELAAAGPRYTEHVLVTQIVPLPSGHMPGMVRFREAMARRGTGEQPGFLALEGWVAGKVLAEAIRRAGRDLDTERLVDTLEHVHDLDIGIGTRISFDRGDHEGSRQVWGTVLQPDGTWKQVVLE